MKITILSPAPNLTGGQRVNAIYAERLQARGHELTVYARKVKQPSPSQHIKSLLKLQRPHLIPEVSHYDGMNAGFKLVEHGGPITEQDLPDADVVIATWWETAFIAAHLPASKGRKFHFVQGHDIHYPPKKHITAGCYFLPLKKIVVASWLKDLMASTYGAPDAIVVPNSVDQSLFFAPPRSKQRIPTVGLMYDNRPAKRLEIALKALQLAAKNVPELRVIAFGKTPPSSDLPLPPNSEFRESPAQDQLRNIYAGCDAYLFSSRHEGFGLPVLEAMACRTPVVGTRAGCAPDAISDGINGYLADVDNAEDLAQGLIKILTSSQLEWQGLSDAAYAYTQHYTWDAATDLFEQALLAP